MKEKDLPVTFWLCIDADDEAKGFYVTVMEKLAKMLSCMFTVDLPTPTSDGTYKFPTDTAIEVEYQLDDVSMKKLTEGKMPLHTLLLLTNSPRCPYTLHTNLFFTEGKHYVYYRFLLKRDIVLGEKVKEI